jgi:hypothetical protein
MYWNVIYTGDMRKIQETLAKNSERKGLLDRPRLRWQYHIKITLKAVGCEDIG